MRPERLKELCAWYPVRTIWMGSLVAVATSLALAWGVEAPITLEPGVRQLFVDDFLIAESSGVRRTYHRPQKRGAVLRPDLPSDGELVQVRSAPMWIPDEKVYKLIYLAFPLANHAAIGPAYAVSEDGISWKKPALHQITFDGNTENNHILVDPSLSWPHNALENVIHDPDDPSPDRRFKGLLGAEYRIPVVSPDGIHWRQLDVPKLTSGDESQLVLDRRNRRYLALLKTWNEYGRACSIATSEDFEQWTPNRFLFGADARDQELAPRIIQARLDDPGMQHPVFVEPDPASGWTPSEGETRQPVWRAECYNFAAFPYEDTYIGMAMMYFPTGTALPERNNTDGFDQIHLTYSRDLEQWNRDPDRRPFIETSRIDQGLVGVFDRGQLAPTNQPIVKDDELWFYYTGLKWRSSPYDLASDGTPRDPASLTDEQRADRAEGWGAVCLAVLRRDGFVSLDAGHSGGTILTKPLLFRGGSLRLNINARFGDARVDVLDESSVPIDGFSGERRGVALGNGCNLEVRWTPGASLDFLPQQVVRFRITLTNAQLYALWME